MSGWDQHNDLDLPTPRLFGERKIVIIAENFKRVCDYLEAHGMRTHSVVERQRDPRILWVTDNSSMSRLRGHLLHKGDRIIIDSLHPHVDTGELAFNLMVMARAEIDDIPGMDVIADWKR